STRMAPCGEAPSRPSSVQVTTSGGAAGSTANRHLHHRLRAGVAELHRPLELRAEAADGARDRQHPGVGERAQDAALDAPGERLDQVEVLDAPLAVDDALEDPLEPDEALAAGRALSAALVPVEVGEAERRAHDGARVVHHDAPRAAEAGAGRRHRLVVERRVERLLADP